MESTKISISDDSISDTSSDESETKRIWKIKAPRREKLHQIASLPNLVTKQSNQQSNHTIRSNLVNHIEDDKKVIYSIDDSSSSDDEFLKYSGSQSENYSIGPFSQLLYPSKQQQSNADELAVEPSRLTTTISDSSSERVTCQASPSSIDSFNNKSDCIDEDSSQSHESSSDSSDNDDRETILDLKQSQDSDSDEPKEVHPPHPLQHLLLISNTKGTNSNPENQRLSPGVSINHLENEKHVVTVVSAKSNSTDSLLNWRKCLWPPLSPFYRVFLRCKCVSMDQNHSTADLNGNNNKRACHGNRNTSSSNNLPPLTAQDLSSTQDIALEWTEFWDNSCLEDIPTTFENAAGHRRIFYHQLLEECRSWMCTRPSLSPNIRDNDEIHRNPSNQAQFSKRRQFQGSWVSASIKMVSHYLETNIHSTAELSDGVNSDPNLGSLLVLSTVILPSNRSDHRSEKSSSQSWNESSSSCSDLRPGDLLLIKSSHLGQRIALGIVQIWNPDAVLCTTSPQMSDSTLENENQSVRIVVCICKANLSTSGLGDNNLKEHKRTRDKTTQEAVNFMNVYGGWMQVGDVCQGSTIDLMVISNTVTASRECQALSSLSYFPPKLQQILLNPSPDLAYPRVHSPPVGDRREEDRDRDGDRDRDRGRGSGDTELVNCPIGVPMPLWSALQQRYNTSQMRAISSICLNNPDQPSRGAQQNLVTPSTQTHFPFLLLQGPPGTGKTHTILGLLSVLLAVGVPQEHSKKAGQRVAIGASLSVSARNSYVPPSQKIRILLCAPSNTAIDEVVSRILSNGVFDHNGKRKRNLLVVRIGQTNEVKNYECDGVVTDLQEVTLDALVEKRRRELEIAQQKAILGRDGSGFLPRIPGTTLLRQLVLEEADIVCCTLSGAGSPQLLECVMNTSSSSSSSSSPSSAPSSSSSQSIHFDVVIIDEAAQAVEPSTIIPFKYNPKMIILVGDPKQLCAVVQSPNTMRCGYGRSLFERLNEAGYPMLMLETQYRMHPEIAYFPSNEFYQGRLRNDPQMNSIYRRNQVTHGSHWKPYHEDPSRKYYPLIWHDFYFGRQELVGTSYRNQLEADYILNLVIKFRKLYPSQCCSSGSSGGGGGGGIGIIAAYKAQQKYLKQIFHNYFGNIFHKRSNSFYVEISTVDGFQGREMDIIIFSCVRTMTSTSTNGINSAGIGFMADWQRLNVAITRAKYGLWIIGDMRKLESGGDVWRHFIQHFQNRRLILKVD